MLRTYKKHILLTGLAALLFILASCGMPGMATSSSAPTQTLQNSATAMSHLNSAHIDLQAKVNVQSAPSSTNSNTSALTFNVTGHSDVAHPDQVSADLQLGQTPLLSVVSAGQKVYVRGKNGTWFFLDKSQVKDGTQDFFSQSLTQRMGQIMAILQNAKLTDHGQESLNGQKLDHITATLDQQSLQALSGQLNALLPADQQSVQNQVQKATLDLWIDQSTSYVHQAKLDVVTQVDIDKIPTLAHSQISTSSTLLPVELNVQVNFSKFNQPLHIQIPTNAVPFTN